MIRSCCGRSTRRSSPTTLPMIQMYRDGNAYHGAHPFFMWYWGENGRQHVGRIIVAGAKNQHVPEILGWESAESGHRGDRHGAERARRLRRDHHAPCPAHHDPRGVLSRCPAKSCDRGSTSARRLPAGGVLLLGGTGFLGKVCLGDAARVLPGNSPDLPDGRAPGEAESRSRFDDLMENSPAFARLRTRTGPVCGIFWTRRSSSSAATSRARTSVIPGIAPRRSQRTLTSS